MSDRRFAPRAASIMDGCSRFLVVALFSTLMVVSLGATTAVAQESDGVTEAESAGEIPVTLGRPGDSFADNGWFDSGPAVPLMALSTLVMLGVGAVIIAGRCRQHPSTDSPTA